MRTLLHAMPSSANNTTYPITLLIIQLMRCLTFRLEDIACTGMHTSGLRALLDLCFGIESAVTHSVALATALDEFSLAIFYHWVLSLVPLYQ